MAMEWHATDVKSLAIIDAEIGDRNMSASEYEVVRRVIYATADLEYKSLVHFSERALVSAAAALSARSPIVTDVSMIQVAIAKEIQQTFANPVYCCTDVSEVTASTAPGQESQIERGFKLLAQRHPEAIFIIGQSVDTFVTLLELIKSGTINPAFAIATPPCFLDAQPAKAELQQSNVPHILTTGRKGNPTVAIAIIDALIDLAWQAYGDK